MAELLAEEIEALFTRTDGTYRFARWARPIAPVIFGVEEETISTLKGAFEALCAMTGHHMSETDPELGTNVMVFFFRDWRELLEVPDLDRLVRGLRELVARLHDTGANQYRVFRFDEAGAIKACFIFIRMDEHMSQVPAETLALAQVTQSFVLWSDRAFTERSPLGKLEDGRVILRPDIADILRAAYDPVLPVFADDASHALRLAARVTVAKNA